MNFVVTFSRLSKILFMPLAVNPQPPVFADGDDSPRFRQHRKVTFSHQKKISVLSKRIMARVLEQIKFGATELCPSYRVSVMDLIKDTSLDPDNVYRYAKAAVNELADVRWNIEDLERKIYIPRHLLNTSLPEAEASRVEGGLITIVLNPALAPYFVALAGSYTSFPLDGYLDLSSFYSMRFFEILATYADTGWWKVELSEYRALMGCGPELGKLGKEKKGKNGQVKMKLATTKDLIKKTILVAQKELAGTPYAFDYTAMTAKGKAGRPKIESFEFRLLRPRLKHIPQEWLQEPASARLIDGLRKFAVSDANIIAYWDVLKPAGLRRLLREWQLKENSQDRINSKVSYCNAAVVREGKKLLEYQRQAALNTKGKAQQELFPASTALPAWLGMDDNV